MNLNSTLFLSFLFVLLGFKQCAIPTKETQTTVVDSIAQTDTTFIEEYFVDSLSIGNKTKNKIELTKYRSTDSVYAVIKFFTKANNRWQQANEFVLPKDGLSDCDALITDYNNDGQNDFSFISSIAARGANEVRTLFLYDKKSESLLHIKNSDDYPNLSYNSTLNCMDAFLVYAGCMTMFLRFEGDSLLPFASVELFDGLEIKEYDKNGNETIILKDTSVKDMFVHYKNYKPLIAYEEY